MEPLSIASITIIAKNFSIIVSVLGLLFGVFKVINWVKSKLTNIDANVIALKNSMDTHITGLRDDIKDQTAAITSALSEQRQDFRTFYAPMSLLMQNQQNQYQAIVAAKKPIKRKSRVLTKA